MLFNLKKSIQIGCLLMLGLSSEALAQLRLPALFSDHMVLQRETDANIWGWAPANTSIKITGSWSADTVTTVAKADGRWRVVLPTGTQGGPYQLSVQGGGETVKLSNLLLGDVYLCSGQSNMEWSANHQVKEVLDELPNVKNDNIRLLNVARYGADTPQENIHDQWTELSPASLRTFSAIGYFIAKKLEAETGVPIGIINASWGGTAAEVWTPKELIENNEDLKKWASQLEPNPWWPIQSGSLWNGMIAPLAGLPIKAAFWYQGESNVNTWAGYDQLMQLMVGSWRKAWQADFPFYFVQIAPFAYKNDIPKAALLREQQTKTALSLSKANMAVITDLVDNINDIHPAQKRDVANRLADFALVELYDKNIRDYKSPIYKSQEIKDSKIEIDFHFLEGNLVAKGKEITDIFIAGEDKVFHPAKASIRGNKLIVESKQVKAPRAVRFGFSEVAMPNLFNERGLPVSPFRTDDWTF